MDYTSSNLDVSFDLNTLPTDQIFNSTFNYNDSTFTIFASIAPSAFEATEIKVQEPTQVFEQFNSQSVDTSATLSASENGESAAMVGIEDLIFMDTDDLIVEEQFGENGEITEIPITQQTFFQPQQQTFIQPQLQTFFQPQQTLQEPKLQEENHNVTIIGEIVRCNTCSLDLPSMAYFKRHVTTKKHERARKMELRGRKVNQKKRYVRKCNRINFQSPSPVPADLTNDEAECLQILDEQLSNSGITMKNFYENFDFDEDMNVENQIEVLDTLVQSNEEISIDQSQQFEIIEEAEVSKPIILNIEDLGQVQNQEFIDYSQIEFNLQPQSTQEIFVEPFIEVEERKTLSPAFRNLQQILSKKVVTKPKPMNVTQTAPQHYCKPCNKYFAKQCHFTQHINIAHSNDRRFRCSKCGKKYPTMQELEMHIVKHNDNKPFKCGQCEKSYNNKIDLKRHEKVHSGFRQHCCETCGRGFVRYDHLQKHYAVHIKKNVSVKNF